MTYISFRFCFQKVTQPAVPLWNSSLILSPCDFDLVVFKFDMRVRISLSSTLHRFFWCLKLSRLYNIWGIVCTRQVFKIPIHTDGLSIRWGGNTIFCVPKKKSCNGYEMYRARILIAGTSDLLVSSFFSTLLSKLYTGISYRI